MIVHHYCTQTVKDGMQIQVCNINSERVSYFSQFTSVKVKKDLRKCQAHFREKLRQLMLRQNRIRLRPENDTKMKRRQ